MAESTIIILGGTEYTIAPPPFGLLKKIIVAFNRASSAGLGTDAGLDAISSVLALMIGKTSEEMDALPITMSDIINAMDKVPQVLGLVKKDTLSGEAQVA